MPESTEDIQGKLAAYIDGELAGADRDEIERHLAANPSHRTLVDELSQQRNALGRLPREAAPGDLMEELQGQLERETLLGGEESLAAQTPLRIRPWPQIISIAAMLVLAIGIGVLVYSMFPKGKPQVAIAPHAEKSEPGKAKVVELAKSTLHPEPIREREAVLPGVRGRGIEPPDQNLFAANASAGTFTPADSSGMLYVTVTANDVPLADSAVVGFLDQNKIRWSKPQEPAGAPGEGGVAQTFAFQATANAPLVAASRDDFGRNEEETSAADVTEKLADGTARRDSELGRSIESLQHADAPLQPLALGAAIEPANTRLMGARQRLALRREEETAQRVILVHNINGKQLAQLTSALSEGDKGQVAIVSDSEAKLRGWQVGLVGQAKADLREYGEQVLRKPSAFEPWQEPKEGPALAEATRGIIVEPAQDLPIRAGSLGVLGSDLASLADPVEEQLIRAKRIELDPDGPTTNADVRYACVIVLQSAPAAAPASKAATTQPATIK